MMTSPITPSYDAVPAISPTIFRAYDIRGIYQEELTEDSARLVGQAVGSCIRDKHHGNTIVVGRDGRLSSPVLAAAVIEGLRYSGCHVVDLGIIPTPALYFAIQSGDIKHGIMVTGSHNPVHYNGLKIVVNGRNHHTHQIEALYQRIQQQQLFSQPAYSSLETQNALNYYVEAIQKDVDLQRPLRIGIDCGNGAAGLVADKLFRGIGCDVHGLFCELDGDFPNHSPDPTQPKNLQALQQLVTDKQLNLGLAFDGDADRVIAVDGNGHIIWPDRLLMLLAQHILPQHPGRTVAYDVKCSHHVQQSIRRAGGTPLMCVSGHSLLKEQMDQHDAILGGEFSGHIVLRDRSFYFDDGLYVAARLLEVLASSPLSPTEQLRQIPENYSTPEYKLYFRDCQAAEHAMQQWSDNENLQADRLIRIDGLRAEYTYGWGLARRSHTTPCITLRFEAETQEHLAVIQKRFRDDVLRLQLDCELTF